MIFMNTRKMDSRLKFFIVSCLVAMMVMVPMQAWAQDTQDTQAQDTQATQTQEAQIQDTQTQVETPDVLDVQLVEWSRIAGQDRLGTMAKISQAGFNSADTVVVAYAYNFPDALSATSLAGYYNSPILLCSHDKLNTETAGEIERLGATKVIIIGGEAGISKSVENQIKNLDGVLQVDRIAGQDRYETSQAVYDMGESLGAWDKQADTKTAIIASGQNFADALSMSPYAYATGSPILLADSDGNLTKESFVELFHSNFKQIVIAGGTGVVSQTTQNVLQAFLGDDKAVRLAGEDRYETSSKVVSWCIDNGMTYEGLCVASGEQFPDALSGGAFCGSKDSIVMLASDTNNNKCTKTLGDNKKTILEADVLGGTGSMSGSLYNTLEKTTYKHWIKDYSQDWVEDSAAWSEKVYGKNLYSVTRCNVCGQCFCEHDDYEGVEDYEEYYTHCYEHEKNKEGNGWSQLDVDGYNTVWHAASGHWENTVIGGHWDSDGGSESKYTRPEHTHTWQEQTQTLVYPASDFIHEDCVCNLCGEHIDWGPEMHMQLTHGYAVNDELYANPPWHFEEDDPIHWDEQTWTYITGYVCLTCGETK